MVKPTSKGWGNIKVRCPPGYVWDNQSKTCKPIIIECNDPNSHWDSGLRRCVCNTGYHLENGICVRDIQPCPPNSTRNSQGICVCNSGFEMVGGVCVPVCPPNSTRNSSGVCVCNSGYHMENGVCVRDQTGGQVDRFGIRKIYADAASPQYAFLDPASINSGRIDNKPGTWQLAGSAQTTVQGIQPVLMGGTGRAALWSADNRPWGNVEQTFYFRMITGPTSGTSGDAARCLQPYIGGGHHHGQLADSGEGNSYKISIMGGGVIVFRKELFHQSNCGYCGDRTGTWNGPVRNFVAGWRRWYGLKQVQLLLADRNRIEVYIDEGADQGGKLNIAGNESRWRLLAWNEDVVTGQSGGQPVSNWRQSCPIPTFNSANLVGKTIVNGSVRLVPWGVTHSSSAPNHDFSVVNAASVQLRTDGQSLYLAYWSAREINPAIKATAEMQNPMTYSFDRISI